MCLSIIDHKQIHKLEGVLKIEDKKKLKVWQDLYCTVDCTVEEKML